MRSILFLFAIETLIFNKLIVKHANSIRVYPYKLISFKLIVSDS